MQYLSISAYAKKLGVSRQAIQDRIARGTLATVVRSKKEKLIPFDDQNNPELLQDNPLAPCKVTE